MSSDAQRDFSLYKSITEPTLTRYLIAHRSATIVPLETAALFPPYANSVRISAVEGKDASAIIRIHAEDIYLYAGSVFHFPGKSVVLSARRIFLVRLPGSDASTVTFDLSGLRAKDYKPETAAAHDPAPPNI